MFVGKSTWRVVAMPAFFLKKTFLATTCERTGDNASLRVTQSSLLFSALIAPVADAAALVATQTHFAGGKT
jgi:hypothetical protein